MKSRAQRDRESGYYKRLPRVGSAHKSPKEQLDEILAEANDPSRLRELPPAPRGCLPTPLGRLKEFRRRYATWPGPKEWLAILFPSEWLAEKLWPRWEPPRVTRDGTAAFQHFRNTAQRVEARRSQWTYNEAVRKEYGLPSKRKAKKSWWKLW